MVDVTIITMGVCIVLLSVAVAKLNDKIDKQIQKFTRLEEALKKNASGTVRQASKVEKHTEEVY